MRWNEIWDMHFSKIDNPTSWQEELKTTLRPSPSEGEVSNAIRDMSKDEKTLRNPTIRHLMAAIINVRRKAMREDTASCGKCNNGFVRVNPNSARYGPDYRTSAPCDCSLGLRRAQNIEQIPNHGK